MPDYPPNNLKLFREHRGYTQKQLAEKAGYSENYITMVETRRKKLSLKFARAISQVLQISPDDLFGDPEKREVKKIGESIKRRGRRQLSQAEREEAAQIEQALQSAPPEILEAMRVLGEYAIDDLPPERLAAASPEARAVIERMRYEIYEQSEQEKIERMQREIAELRRENARLKRDRKDN